jgi:hypothetical protein
MPNPTDPIDPTDPAGRKRRLVREIAIASAAPSPPWHGSPTRLARVALAEAAGLLPRRPAGSKPTPVRPADQHHEHQHQHEHAERGTADDHQHQDHDD